MNIAIAGFGIEGKASAAYWQQKGCNVTVLDEKPIADVPAGIKVKTGADAFDELSPYDMVVRTASLNPKKLVGAKKVWSATNEFFSACPAPIIGVTGTKGKGTTCSLVASILRAAGKTAHLVGNIGVPALEILPTITADDIVVFELSSFQLWDMERSPHIAVILMIESDHQDIHADMDEYVAAKANIRKHQGLDDTCYYHPTNTYAHAIAMAGDWPLDADEQRQWQENAFRYATREAVYMEDGNFMVHEDVICPTSAVQLPGEFNLQNACAAISAARHFTVDPAAIQKGLQSFTGLPHRLKYVGTKHSVRYYDDSIATTPGSAIAALGAFTEPKVIILGGSSKGADYTELVAACGAAHAQIIAIGQTGEQIYSLALKQGITAHRVTGKMADAVRLAHSIATPGSVVILSPASASFDQYKNYAARGDAFVKAVEQLA